MVKYTKIRTMTNWNKIIALAVIMAFLSQNTLWACPKVLHPYSSLQVNSIFDEDKRNNETQDEARKEYLSRGGKLTSQADSQDFYAPCSSNELERINETEGSNLQKVKELARRVFSEKGLEKKVLFVTATGKNLVGIRRTITRVLASSDIAGQGSCDVVYIDKKDGTKVRRKEVYGVFNNASVPEYLMRRSNSSDYIRQRRDEEDLLDSAKGEIYEQSIEESLQIIEEQHDLEGVSTIFLDDIYPLGLIPKLRKKYPHIKLIWVNHRDYSQILEVTKKFLWKYLKEVDMVIGWSKEDFPDYPQEGSIRDKAHILPVAGLNPLDFKNIELDDEYINYIQKKYGISNERPIMFQMGRFALIKDFYMTVRAYLYLKQKWLPSFGALPQLVLASPFENTQDADEELKEIHEYVEYLINEEGIINPEDIKIVPLILPRSTEPFDESDVKNARELIFRLAKKYGGDFGGYLRQVAENMSAADEESKEVVNHLEVNALQRISDLGIHASVYESFGMVITELLWKGKITIGSTTGGVPQQYPQDLQKDLLLDIPQGYKEVLRELQYLYKLGKYSEVYSILAKKQIPDPAEELAQKMFRFFGLTDEERDGLREKFKKHIKKKYLILNCVFEYLELLQSLNNIEKLADVIIEKLKLSSTGKIVVGVSGPIGIGKTEFASHLAAVINRRLKDEDAAGVLNQDQFFCNSEELAKLREQGKVKENERSTMRCVKWAELNTQIENFRRGEPLEQSIIDEWTEDRTPKGKRAIKANRIMIVEGGYLFSSSIKDQLDCKIAMDAGTDELYESYLTREDKREKDWREIPDTFSAMERETKESEVRKKKERIRRAIHWGRSLRYIADIVVTERIDVVKGEGINTFRYLVQKITVFTGFARGVCATVSDTVQTYPAGSKIRERLNILVNEYLRSYEGSWKKELLEKLEKAEYRTFEAYARPVVGKDGAWECNDFLFCFADTEKNVINICNELLQEGREDLLCKALIEAVYILAYGEADYFIHYRTLPDALRIRREDLDELITLKTTPSIQNQRERVGPFSMKFDTKKVGPLLFISPNARGRGVTEIRRTLCSALDMLGIQNTWIQMVRNENPDFNHLHDAIGAVMSGEKNENGTPRQLSPNEKERYRNAMRLNMDGLGDLSKYECVYLDDVYSLGLIPEIRRRYPKLKIVWIGHGAGICRNVAFINQYLKDADLAVFWDEKYIPEGLACKGIAMLYGGINPASFKNCSLPPEFINATLEKYGLCQQGEDLVLFLGGFDKFKDPLLAIAAFKEACRRLPNDNVKIQLGIADPAMSPHTIRTYNKLKALLSHDSMKNLNIRLVLLDAQSVEFTKKQEEALREIIPGFGSLSPAEINSLEVNALQQASCLGIHPTEGEAFGLIITEFLYKGKPVLASRVDGALKQITVGPDKFLVPLDNGYVGTEDETGNKKDGTKDRAYRIFLNTDNLIEVFEMIERHPAARTFGERLAGILAMGPSDLNRLTNALREYVVNNFLVQNAVEKHLQMRREALAIDPGQVSRINYTNQRIITKRFIKSTEETAIAAAKYQEKRKVLLALDTDIGDMTQFEIGEMLKQIIDVCSLLCNIEFVAETGEKLPGLINKKIDSLIEKTNINRENIDVVVVTRRSQEEFDSTYHITRVNDNNIKNSGSYVPILELLTFALYINSKEDNEVLKEELKKIYYEITKEILTDELLEQIKKGVFSIPLLRTKELSTDYYNESIEILKSA